jgi:hypothetical protein
VNGHTALIRSFGTTGVLLLLSLVLLAIVSAIVAFDRWPQQSGGAGTVERVAVDRPEAQRVETELVRRRPAPVVRGVFVVRDAGASSAASGSAGALLGGDREPGPQSDGGGFGPPPPPVPFNAPGEGGGRGSPISPGPGPTNRPGPDDDGLIQRACNARGALGEAGTALDPACKPGRRGEVRETLATVEQKLRAAGG